MLLIHMIGERGSYGPEPEKRFINPVTHKPPGVMPGLEGRAGSRPKDVGENVYLQIQLRQKFLRDRLAQHYADDAGVEAAVKMMNADEMDKFPTMSKEELRALADALTRRDGQGDGGDAGTELMLNK